MIKFSFWEILAQEWLILCAMQVIALSFYYQLITDRMNFVANLPEQKGEYKEMNDPSKLSCILQTLSHLAKLPKWWSCVVNPYLYGAFDCMFSSCHVRVSEWIHTPSRCGFESRFSHLNFRYGACFEQGVPWHSGKGRVDSRWNAYLTWWKHTVMHNATWILQRGTKVDISLPTAHQKMEVTL